MPKILNFIPLLVWSIGFLFFASLDDHWCRKDGVNGKNEEESKAATKMYTLFCVFWLILGIILSI